MAKNKKKKKQSSTKKEETQEKLINSLVKSVNRKHKGADVAHILGLAGDKAAVNVKDWISTGSTLLDLASANRYPGGVATGKVTELTGMEGSGKSLIGAHILASTQKAGGIAIYIDTESAVSIDFLKVIGVDVDKLIYLQLETVEDIYETIEEFILKLRKADKDKLITILVDSMSGATTKMEDDADYGRDGWSTGKAIINSKAMRKITNLIAKERIALVLTNQLRIKLGVQFGDNKTTSGGVAIAFHSSTRIRLKKALKIKDKSNEIIGLYIKAKITKSRFGPSYRTVEFPLYFSSGIDDDGSLLVYMRKKKLVKVGGGWYTLEKVNNKTGEIKETKFRAKKWPKLLKETKGLREYILNLIKEEFIMKYEIPEDPVDIDSIKIEKEEESEDEYETIQKSSKEKEKNKS